MDDVFIKIFRRFSIDEAAQKTTKSSERVRTPRRNVRLVYEKTKITKYALVYELSRSARGCPL